MIIEVTRTVLVEEVIRYDTKEDLWLSRSVNPVMEMENIGGYFAKDVLLIEKETAYQSVKTKEIISRNQISDPVIIKIERV